MARIVVHRASFENGTFPPVCCKTGVHTDNYERWNFTRSLSGRLPITTDAHRSADRMRRASWMTGLLALVLAVASGVLDRPAMYAGVVVWILFALLAMRATPNAKAVGEDSVELSNVHRRFVETIEAAWAQRNAPSQPG